MENLFQVMSYKGQSLKPQYFNLLFTAPNVFNISNLSKEITLYFL